MDSGFHNYKDLLNSRDYDGDIVADSLTMNANLDMNTYSITNVNLVDGVDVSALSTESAGFYKLDGTRALTGTMDAGAFEITNVGDVDGVNVSALSTTVGTNTTNITTNASCIAQNRYATSTGLLDGGILSINSGDNKTFDLSAGSGLIYDEKTGLTNTLTWTAFTAQSVPNIAIQNLSFIYMDADGNLQTSGVKLTNVQFTENILFGAVIHVNRTNLDTVNTEASYCVHPYSQFAGAFRDIFNFVNLSGNVFSGNAINTMRLDKSLGTVFGVGLNYGDTQAQHDNPNNLTVAAEENKGFQYRLSDGTSVPTSGENTDIDPNTWESSAGVASTVTNNRFTVQAIWLAPTSGNVKIQYGSQEFKSIQLAEENLGGVLPSEQSLVDNLVLISYLIVKKGCTDLGDTTTALFLKVGKFQDFQSTSTISVTSLQGAYENSISGATASIVLDNLNHGPIDIAPDPTGADSDILFETENLASTVTFSVKASGAVNCTTLDVGSGLITNLLDPVGAQDAATKTYVDTHTGGTYLPLSGGAMTGGITGLTDLNGISSTSLAYLVGLDQPLTQASGVVFAGMGLTFDLNMLGNDVVSVSKLDFIGAGDPYIDSATTNKLLYNAGTNHTFKISTTEVFDIVSSGITFVGNINSIPSADLAYVSGLDQNLATTNSPSFSALTTQTLNFTSGSNGIIMKDNVSQSLSFTAGGNSYMSFTTTLADESIDFLKIAEFFDTVYLTDVSYTGATGNNFIEFPLSLANGFTLKTSSHDYITLDSSGSRSIDLLQPATFASTLNGISTTTFSYLDATSSIQTQINGKQATISNGVETLTSGEVDQLKNIGITTIVAQEWLNLSTSGSYSISSSNWSYLSNTNQNINTSADVKFDTLELTQATAATDTILLPSKNISLNALYQLADIGTTLNISSQDWIYMAGNNQDLSSTANVDHYRLELGVSGSTNTTRGGLVVYGCANICESSYQTTVGTDFYNQIYIRHPESTSSTAGSGWVIGNKVGTTTNCDLHFAVQESGTMKSNAYIQNSVSSETQMNFTGQHRCCPMFEYGESHIGLIVESTGKYCNLMEKDKPCSSNRCITINDSLPTVQICNEEKSKKIFGVISAGEAKKREWQNGVFVSNFDKLEGDNRIFVNGLGEGGLWVSNANGPLENGDYICSWLNGYGQKQDSEFYANYTVAKITMDCDFNPAVEPVKIYDYYDEEKHQIIYKDLLDENGDPVYEPAYKVLEMDDGVRIAFVGAVYLCS